MKFIDEAEITVRSGDGGSGCISFHRERFLPKGGPDGGNGGRGGSILFKAVRRLHSLYDFESKRYFKAQNGGPGGSGNRTGKRGRDTVILVPAGTIIRDKETGELLADLVQDNHQITLVEGGQGGKGNRHFATSTNRAPRFAQEGQKGQERRLILDLKLIADVGIIGLPNSGKSTLLSRLSSAHPKIADYPFTTLSPNLGIAVFDDEQALTLADIPGLIEGASNGKGLGHKFLQHIERTTLLLHMLDINRPRSGDVLTDFSIVQEELERFHPSLRKKEQVVAINKIDIAPVKAEELRNKCRTFCDQGYECRAISALTGEGIEELKELLREKAFSQL
jgi:GTP-binding protein